MSNSDFVNDVVLSWTCSLRGGVLMATAWLTRLSQFAGVFGYFRFKMTTKFNDCSEAISKRLR